MVDTGEVRTFDQLLLFINSSSRTLLINDFFTEVSTRHTSGVRTSDGIKRVIALDHFYRRTILVASSTSEVPTHIRS